MAVNLTNLDKMVSQNQMQLNERTAMKIEFELELRRQKVKEKKISKNGNTMSQL